MQKDWTHGRALWQVQIKGPEAAAAAEPYKTPRILQDSSSLHDKQRNWTLTSTFTPCCNSLKESQANSRHFHTGFPGVPQIFSFVW